MAWAAALGGLLGAGGQIAGGLLGQTDGGSPRNSNYNPALDYALQAAQFDALNQIGFGNINSVPDPIAQLAAQIQALPWVDKSKQKALLALQNIRQQPSLLDDPYGANFTRDEIMQANKTGAPFGRRVTRGSSGGGTSTAANGAIGAASGLGIAGPVGALAGGLAGAFGGFGSGNDTEPNGLRVEGIKTLEKSLQAMGMNLGDLQKKLAQQAEYEAQLKRLNEAGLGRMNEQTILGRANAASTAAQLTSGAADFAKGGPLAPGFMTDIFNRDERQMQDMQSQLGIMANFGGINPAQLFESMTDAKLDQNLRLIEQQLGMSNALSAALNPGLAAGAQAGAASSGNAMNAVQIAAAQAQAANSIRSASQQNNATSLANGIAGGLGSLGSGLGNYSLMNSLNSMGGVGGVGGNFTAGLNFGNVANQFAVPGVYNGGAR